MSWAQILPMAFVMIAGPQIISSFFFATSDNWVKNSIAYVAGAFVSVTAIVTIAYVVAKGAKSAAGSSSSGGANTTLDWIVLVLLVVLAIRVYATRETSEPPKWMAKLQTATPRFAFLLGMALLGIFPTDILTSITVGLHVARNGDPWYHCLSFIGLTVLLVAGPALTLVLLGNRGKEMLPKIRDWMNANSWVVSEVVLVFFALITVNSLRG